MTWDDIREQHPDRWVVIEATSAHTDEANRVLDEIVLLATFDDSVAAWDYYQSLHREHPEREYYPYHTSREQLDIGVIDAFGRIIT